MATSISVRGVATPIDEVGHFLPRRSSLWAIRVGYWFGRGYSAAAVAQMVGENTTAGTVAGRVRKAGVLPDKARRPIVPVEIPSWQRDIIADHAARRGLSLQQIIHQVLESTLVLDDLYVAVTDGRYDPSEHVPIVPFDTIVMDH